MKILGISGSLRRASFNTALVRLAFSKLTDAECTLADIRLPLFDEDLEAEGTPREVTTLVGQIRASDGVLISTPEYNKNLPGGLKNALDWISRDDDQPLNGKPVVIMSAAAGRAGGERSQYSLRHCLTPFNPRIMQLPELMVAQAGKAFDADGRLVDERTDKALDRHVAALRDLIGADR
ncbi:NADPH-dependent FMN reductase [Hwanghaeella sp.]|uniref:NADPH-dependent FMN reductase n=1 Tax=Hwanghaeella sp. TaxID=2605943 RepID=UPI003CCBE2CD